MRTLNEDYPLFPVPPISSVQDLLCRSARTFGDKLALEDLAPTPMPRLSYRGLFEAVVRFGRGLGKLHLEPGDHVAVIGENRVQWMVAYLACHAFGLVAVPIDKSLQDNEIITVLHASESKAVVFSERFRDTILTLAPSVKTLKVFVDMDLEKADGRIHSMGELLAAEPVPGLDEALPAVDPEALAVIVFTSGAMGRAKGVMLSQRNLAANLTGMLAMIELFSSDRFLSVLPIHHTYACTCGQLCPLLAGRSVHYARSLKTVLEDLQRVKATILLGVPLLYEKMYRRISAGMAEKKLVSVLLPALRAAAAAGEAVGAQGVRRKLFRQVHERFGGAVRIFIVGGAAPDPVVARGLRSLGFTFIQGYGLTETSPILALNRLRKFRDDAAGIPLCNVEVRIAEPGEHGVGEIQAKGPSVMMGYYRNEEATGAVLQDGWFATGDLGYFDADGFLHVCGRKKNVIVAANGKNVFPEELEDLVNRIPYVLESVVHGVRQPDGDEVIGVIVVPNAEELLKLSHKLGVEVTREWVKEVLEREVRALNRHLASYKQIRQVRVQESEFAKTTTQKIKRHLIHQQDTTH